MQYLHSCHCLRPLHGLTHFLDTRTQPVLVLGIIILQVQDPVFAFVEFQMLPLCPSLQPLKLPLKGYTALCGIGHSSQVCVISRLAEDTSGPSSKSLMEKLNSTGPCIEPWGTPLLTGIQLDPVAVIKILWDLPLSQVSIHLTVHSSRLHFH